MTIAKGRASIFTLPRFLGFALHWPTRIYANFVAKNPSAASGEGYIVPWLIVLAFDPVDARKRVETLGHKRPAPA